MPKTPSRRRVQPHCQALGRTYSRRYVVNDHPFIDALSETLWNTVRFDASSTGVQPGLRFAVNPTAVIRGPTEGRGGPIHRSWPLETYRL